MASTEPRVTTFSIRGPIGREDLPGLCDRVCRLLEKLAERLQILILTCHPERFSELKDANRIDLRKVIDIDVPAYRVTYELEEVGSPTIADVLRPVLG